MIIHEKLVLSVKSRAYSYANCSAMIGTFIVFYREATQKAFLKIFLCLKKITAPVG
ncbi:hypothetical protein [Neobacillus endophyticus]|uniref:hypothetical protein n=1 Tax=Neobacillus endophyticus TaxID=2738405 RepID=UPI001C27E041|nr:hypothetical protein [Neobacillus endophyticus]